MPSEGARSVPHMGSFKRALLGYRRADVDAAIVKRNERIVELEAELPRIAELERELACLSAIVIERERELRDVREELREANERQDRSIASLEAISRRLEEIQAQARGQATRIRMKALREAVEVSRRVQDMAGQANGNGHSERDVAELFEGLVKVEIGPLGDFSQLVGFEDAAERIGATSEISVERFSEGRATLSMRLSEPVALLRELEELSPLEFKVRHTAGDRVVLDVDEEQGPEQKAA
jgi:DNA repair exonuclease SbcCD ATPase subunit